MARNFRNGDSERTLDYDIQPGSSRDSAPYASRYDPQGEREFANLPENANQLEAKFLQRAAYEQARASRADQLDAMSRVQFMPDVGKFVLTKSNTFAAHLEKVIYGEIDIHFDPERYKLFDKIIAEKSGLKGLYDPNNPHYAFYEDMRNNIAVLRNFIYSHMFRDGSFDVGSGDEKYLDEIQAIAGLIGEGIRNDTSLKRMVAPALNTQLANIEGEGAAEMYRYLERMQPTGWMGKLQRAVRWLLGKPIPTLDLPPMEQTPFSREGLAVSLDDLVAQAVPAPTRDSAEQGIAERIAVGMQLAHYANGQAVNIRRFKNVEEMEDDPREESLELAREILRRLREMKFGDKNAQELVDLGTPDEKLKKAEAMAQLLAIYEDYRDAARRVQPEVMNDPKMQEAEDAAGVLTHALKLMAAKEMPSSVAAAQQISADITQTPDKWKDLENRHVDRLIQSIEGGLEQSMQALDMQQQEHDQDQEIAQEAADQHLAHQHGQKRRRKRKAAASGLGGKKQSKLMRDINADDYALGQGRFRRMEETTQDNVAREAAATAPRINLPDLDKIRELGKTLKGNLDTAANLEPPKPGEPMSPDQSFVARKEQNERNNNNKLGV